MLIFERCASACVATAGGTTVAGSAVLAGLSPVAVVLAGSASPWKCSTSTKTAAIAASGVGTETIIAVWDPSAVRLTTWLTSVAS